MNKQQPVSLTPIEDLIIWDRVSIIIWKYLAKYWRTDKEYVDLIKKYKKNCDNWLKLNNLYYITD